jgi:hypothetical protein
LLEPKRALDQWIGASRLAVGLAAYLAHFAAAVDRRLRAAQVIPDSFVLAESVLDWYNAHRRAAAVR